MKPVEALQELPSIGFLDIEAQILMTSRVYASGGTE